MNFSQMNALSCNLGSGWLEAYARANEEAVADTARQEKAWLILMLRSVFGILHLVAGFFLSDIQNWHEKEA